MIYYGRGTGEDHRLRWENAIRYASAGKTVCIVQFMKGQLSTSYLSRLEPEIKIFRFERSPEGFDTLTDEEKQEEKVNIANGLNFAKKVLTTGRVRSAGAGRSPGTGGGGNGHRGGDHQCVEDAGSLHRCDPYRQRKASRCV